MEKRLHEIGQRSDLGELIGTVTEEKDGLVPQNGFYSKGVLTSQSLTSAPLGTYRSDESTNYPSNSPYPSGVVANFGSIGNDSRFMLFARPEGLWVNVNWNGWQGWKKISFT